MPSIYFYNQNADTILGLCNLQCSWALRRDKTVSARRRTRPKQNLHHLLISEEHPAKRKCQYRKPRHRSGVIFWEQRRSWLHATTSLASTPWCTRCRLSEAQGGWIIRHSRPSFTLVTRCYRKKKTCCNYIYLLTKIHDNPVRACDSHQWHLCGKWWQAAWRPP